MPFQQPSVLSVGKCPTNEDKFETISGLTRIQLEALKKNPPPQFLAIKLEKIGELSFIQNAQFYIPKVFLSCEKHFPAIISLYLGDLVVMLGENIPHLLMSPH